MVIDKNYILKLILDFFQLPPSNLEKINMGVMTFKYIFEINNQKFVIRIYPSGNPIKAETEYKIINRLRNAGCKVPQVVHYSEAPDITYMIYRFIEGIPLSFVTNSVNDSSLKFISQQITENIRVISSQSVEHFGPVNSKSKHYKTWNSFLNTVLKDGFHHLEKNKIFESSVLQDIYNNLELILNKIEIKQPFLVWSDLSQDNVIIENNSLAGLIDFESCLGGDPMLSLGYLFAIEGYSRFFKLVADEFQKYYPVKEEYIYFYAFIRLFRLAPHLNKPLPIGISREPVLKYFSGLNTLVLNSINLQK